jgi:hypothetical protein
MWGCRSIKLIINGISGISTIDDNAFEAKRLSEDECSGVTAGRVVYTITYSVSDVCSELILGEAVTLKNPYIFVK